MATPGELLAQSLAKFRSAKRVSGASASYKKDNPNEYVKVIAYLDGGARPSGVTTDMGMGLLLEEDARRALVVPSPSPSRWWSDSSPWNTKLTGTETIDSTRTAYLQGLGEVFDILWKSYGVAYYEAPAGTPRYTVSYTAQDIKIANVPIPAGVIPANGTDAHLAIVDTDPAAPTCGCVYDFLHPGQVAGSGSGFDYTNPRGDYIQREMLYTSTGWVRGSAVRGASAMTLGGLITPQELQLGKIEHALAIYVPAAEADNGQPVLPSYTSDGTSTTSKLPESARIRVNPSFDASGLAPWQQTVVTALKTYGGFIIDQGGCAIAAVDNSHSGWGPAYPWGATTYPSLPLSVTQAMQVITLGPRSVETYNPVYAHPCGDFYF